MLQGDSDTLNVSAFKLTQLQMQWGYNIKKQWINAEQTPKLDTEQWVNGEQAAEKLLKHSVVLLHTFASTEQKIMLTNVWLSRKMRKQKKRAGKAKALCLSNRTVIFKHKTIHLYMQILSICGSSLCCMFMCDATQCPLSIYLHLGLRITYPNRSQGKAFIWRTLI